MKVVIEIDDLINHLVKKLPGVKVVGYQQKPRLSVWNIQVEYHPVPVFEKYQHASKLRTAWLAEGKVGLLRYIEPYIKPNRLASVRKTILSIEHPSCARTK